MAASAGETFRCEVKQTTDEQGRTTSQVLCSGRLVAGDTAPLKEAVQPLLQSGAHVVIDCSGLAFVDSMGLGALVALKVSSMSRGNVRLEYVNLTPRVKELLRITKLTDYLARPDTINYGDGI